MNIYITLVMFLSMLTSLLAVCWIFFKILKIAKEKNLVDNPDARKLQKNPVPLVGGLAVFFGVVFGLLFGVSLFFLCSHCTECPDLSTGRLLPIVLAMSIMLYAGAIDDILGLTPKARFVIEILVVLGVVFSTGTCVDSLHGLWGVSAFSWWLAVPLTVFAGVGIINSVNMVDGVNGLSSGLCAVCSFLFGAIFFTVGDYSNALLGFVMSVALLPFLVHNVFGNTSRMFIGDAGTMVMGMLMVWFVISALHATTPLLPYTEDYCVVALVFAVLAVPVSDTLRVMIMRILRGRSPFSPDRTHLHHAFVAIGVSHSITALSEICLNLLVVLAWYLSVVLGAPNECQLYVVVLVAAFLVCGTYFFLEHERSSNSRKARWIKDFSLKTHFGSREWWQRISFYLDSPEYSEHERKNLRERLERKFMNR